MDRTLRIHQESEARNAADAKHLEPTAQDIRRKAVMSARAANRLGFELADPDRRAGAFERFCKAMEASESYKAELARLSLDEVPMQ